MGELLSYSIVSGIVMLALYLAYRMFLARDNQHGFNRGVLLLIYLVSFVAAPIYSSLEKMAAQGEAQDVAVQGMEAATSAGTGTALPLWGTVLIWIYMAGAAVVISKTIATWAGLSRIIRKGEKTKRDGYTLVITDNDRYAPFSWMHYVVIGRADYESNCPVIVTHELKHIAYRHWADLLLAQIVCIVNWFNPTAWLMRDELMLVHEYQADMAVVESGHDAQEYQMLLIKKAVGARFPSLANSLNHRKLKKRITMMYKEKSGAGHRFKALALVPMLALALGLAEVPAVRAAVTAISSSEVSANKGNEIPPKGKTGVQYFKVVEINNYDNKTTVIVKGENLGSSVSVSGGTYTDGRKTYQAKSIQCNMTDGVATITLKFPFISIFKSPRMTMTVNGEEIPFDLEKFLEGKDSAAAGATPKDTANATATSESGEASSLSEDSASLPKDMEVYIDGEKVFDTSKLKDISPEKIASITVDKQHNALHITLK